MDIILWLHRVIKVHNDYQKKGQLSKGTDHFVSNWRLPYQWGWKISQWRHTCTHTYPLCTLGEHSWLPYLPKVSPLQAHTARKGRRRETEKALFHFLNVNEPLSPLFWHRKSCEKGLKGTRWNQSGSDRQSRWRQMNRNGSLRWHKDGTVQGKDCIYKENKEVESVRMEVRNRSITKRNHTSKL